MPLITNTEEQQRIRQELGLAVDHKDSELHTKFTSPAIQSSATFSVSKNIDRIEKMIHQHGQSIGALKRDTKPTAQESTAPPAKKPKPNGQPKKNAWMNLKQDSTLRYCPGFDRARKRQCGWNNTHWWGESCPVYQKDPNFTPRFWGPIGSSWASAEDARRGAPLNELKQLFKSNVERVKTRQAQSQQ